MSDLQVNEVYELIHLARKYKYEKLDGDEKGFIANLFYEPSTRTKLSFEMAEKKLGYQTLDFTASTSSVQKGESLYDTVKTLEVMRVSAVVIRHPQEEYYKDLLPNIQIPIINGGDGKGEHPTQCLLDLFTIYEEFGHFEELNIVIAGDILHSRVARSNAMMLDRLGASVYVSGPPEWQDNQLPFPYITLEDAIYHCDVLMLLRIQLERHDSSSTNSEDHYYQQYGLTKERESFMKKDSIILHPGPVNRDVEIADELVECSRSRINTQVNNGVFMRMAVLQTLLKGGNPNEYSHQTSQTTTR